MNEKNKKLLEKITNNYNNCDTFLEYLKVRYNSVIDKYYKELRGVKTWIIPLNSYEIIDGANTDFLFILHQKSKEEIAEIINRLTYQEREYDSFLNAMFDQLHYLYNYELKQFEKLFDLNQLVFNCIYIQGESSQQVYIQLNIDWGSNKPYDLSNSIWDNIAEKIQNTDLMQPLQKMVRELKNSIIKLWRLDTDMLEMDNYKDTDNYLRMVQLDGDNIINGYFISHSEY